MAVFRLRVLHKDYLITNMIKLNVLRALLMLIICFGDLMGSIIDDTDANLHSQRIKDVNKQGWRLVISPVPESEAKVLIKRTDETLNLTCGIEREINPGTNGGNVSFSDQQFKLAWYVPNSLENSKNRVINNEYRNSLQLIVQNLRDSDTGEYKCTGHESTDNPDTHPFSGSLNVQVKPKKGTLGKTNPCDNKLQELNCTARIISPCCNQLQSIQLSLDVSQYSPQPQHYNEIGYLQTTIYTVIGCAMAFMFIITIMVIAICRVHLKRTALTRYPPLPHPGSIRQDPDSWGNVFLQSAAPGLLVAYNINNGLHFMGRPVNPPPYSEIDRVPPNDGPPPPYSSTENLNLNPPLRMGSGQVMLTFANEAQTEVPEGIPTRALEDTETRVPLLEGSSQVE